MKSQRHFFFIGENLKNHQVVAKQVLAAGHSIHNHSHTHRNYRKLSSLEQLHDLNECQDQIERVAPTTKRIFRAPQGQIGLSTLIRLRMRGWHVVHWSYDSMDYTKSPSSVVIDRFRQSPVRDGEILLFHDDDQVCVEVLDTMIPEWKAQGFSFEKIDSLFQ